MRFPHFLSDSQLGLISVIVLPLWGGLFCLYNAYRMGKLKWKPKGPANSRLGTFVIFIGMLLTVVLLSIVE